MAPVKSVLWASLKSEMTSTSKKSIFHLSSNSYNTITPPGPPVGKADEPVKKADEPVIDAPSQSSVAPEKKVDDAPEKKDEEGDVNRY